MKKIFKNFDETFDKDTIQYMCSIIEKQRYVIIANQKCTRWKLISRCSPDYSYDYTYNLIRWGFVKKGKNADDSTAAAPSAGIYYVTYPLQRFVDAALKAGLISQRIEVDKTTPQIIFI